MRLDQLSAGLPGRILRGDGSEEITGIAFDSITVEWGNLFVCVRGMSSDGHDFAQAAAETRALMFVERFVADIDRRLEALGQ